MRVWHGRGAGLAIWTHIICFTEISGILGWTFLTPSIPPYPARRLCIRRFPWHFMRRLAFGFRVLCGRAVPLPCVPAGRVRPCIYCIRQGAWPLLGHWCLALKRGKEPKGFYFLPPYYFPPRFYFSLNGPILFSPYWFLYLLFCAGRTVPAPGCGNWP